jgi:thiosulfate dehydrogenase
MRQSSGTAFAALMFLLGTVVRADATEPSHQLPTGPLGELVQFGETLVSETATHPLTKDYVGN